MFGSDRSAGTAGGPELDDHTSDEPPAEELEDEPAEEPAEDDDTGIGWKALVLFICGGLVITALVVAFMVWVIEGLVL
ncbi:hypothetical protein BBK82_17980 [Lentzea guizhouensis]|uniref:Uncharacterized protein n=1 Tax=Lentzea guizhouensis TaxID=1586287 RepID=A0A1B2HIW7_9PSEU|nr:hypothetical protein [Lentzea guizhouensis]ANZ37661.1 hypothetical protein BBK82_17980 [Lentzea guizhouensis]